MGIQGSGDVRRGFLTQGLFAYSRHPNFFAEQVRSRRALLLLLLQTSNIMAIYMLLPRRFYIVSFLLEALFPLRIRVAN